MSATSALRDSLSQPRAYSHAVDSVTVRETHISWVFLTGEYAYKVKKPVRTPFLDFSTLELRRQFCEEELRLNRRFAPELYLDVVPITGDPEAPRVGGSGLPIEHAVRMRQFPEDRLLSRMIAAGTLSAEQIDQLAATIAAAHRSAERLPTGSAWGRPELIQQEAVDNFAALSPDLPEEVRRLARELESWTRDAGARLSTTFAARREGGWVRECHGDLHLGNLVAWSPPAGDGVDASTRLDVAASPIRLFDGIEFSPEFRWIDVVSDVAFTTMDLADRGRPDFARRLRNAYLERTGDYAGLQVWRWYGAYRALVRAKVASIQAGQQTDAPATQERLLQEAAGYLRLAADESRPATPRLIITCGVSGSGKTHRSQAIVERLGAIRLRTDVERKRLAGLTADARTGSPPGGGIYTPERTQATYDRLQELARIVLQAGFAAVVDGTFLRSAERTRFRELAAELQVPFALLLCEAPQEVLESRLAARRGDASEATAAILARQLADCEPLTVDELPFQLPLDQILNLYA